MMTSPEDTSPGKKVDMQDDVNITTIQKMALEALGWKPEETKFPLKGRIMFTQPREANWKKVWANVKLTPINAILAVMTNDDFPEVGPDREIIFPSDATNIKDAFLIMVEKRNAETCLIRDPLPLDHCVICCEQDWDDVFEIQEFVTKECFVFKGEEPEQTQMWFRTLQFCSQSLGGWRKRRKGLANIMVDSNLVVGPDNVQDDGNELKDSG